MSVSNTLEGTTSAGGPPRSRGSTLWMQGLACGALLTFATPTALLVAILMAPAIICLLAHPGCERGLLRAVVTSCAAASIGPLWHLWIGGGRMDQLAAILASPATLCLAWGGGATAWALCQVLPVMVQTAWDTREARRAKALQRELDALTEEWGLGESGGAKQ